MAKGEGRRMGSLGNITALISLKSRYCGMRNAAPCMNAATCPMTELFVASTTHDPESPSCSSRRESGYRHIRRKFQILPKSVFSWTVQISKDRALPSLKYDKFCESMPEHTPLFPAIIRTSFLLSSRSYVVRYVRLGVSS